MKQDTFHTPDPLLDDLTEPQRQAVTHSQGPLLVLAAAGSGKTRVITRRIAHLVQRVDVAPWHILAITFTNKAAGEMRNRIEQLISSRQARAVTVCTFHGFCARIISEFANHLDLPRTYSIYTTADQNRAMKQALDALHISTSNFPPGRVLSTVSQAKNLLQGPEAYAAAATDFYSKTVAQIYSKYQAILIKNHALDFDDLLLRTVTLFREHDDVLAQLRDRYQYVLIDEYQDTNHAQFTIAHALSSQHQNICATGDPDQSIYGWRGADIRNILEFETHYPKVTSVRLEQNYRSTKSILAVADQLIRNNKQRKHKSLWTENEDGKPILSVTCHDERTEAQWVVDWLSQLKSKNNISWGDMAVFYRVNSLSRVMEDALRTAQVPYQIARGTSFYERKEIKDAIAYLRVVANPADEVNLLRIINHPSRGISQPTVRSLQAHAIAHNMPIVDAASHATTISSLNKRAVVAVKRFSDMVRAWRVYAGFEETPQDTGEPPSSEATENENQTPSLQGLVERILKESGIDQHFKSDRSDPDQERLMNLGELVSWAGQFEEDFVAQQPVEGQPTVAKKLEACLLQISLVSDVDSVDASQGSVTLMTLHAAKGLEFPAVAMIGMEDGLLPHGESSENLEKLEEERRLCFVGITRTQRHLAMTHTRFRTLFGRVQTAVPSRFLEELPDDYLEAQEIASQDAPVASERSVGQVDSEAVDDETDQNALQPGELVRHPQFGLGRVVDIRCGGPQTRARVEFNTAGLKTLVLQYARLEKVSV